MERVLKFLLVEDNPGDADLIIELLSETKLKKSIIQQAGDLKSALAMLNKDTFDIILLDLGLPDSSGLTGLRKIIEINSGIPIVVVSGQDDLTMSKEAIQQGAEDYLIKGRIDDEILSRVVLYSIERNKQKRELQAVYQQLLASEQQLRESNQQLTDSVQQLQASNQQLAASEQQLRVNNHKLAASERELILAKERAEKSELSQIVQKEEIALNNERLESLVRISRLQTSSIQELLDFALEEAIKLTKSKIGYIYFYNETTRQFTLNTWSNEVMQECKVMNPQTVYDLDKTGCWGDAVRQKKPVIINNFPEFNALRKATPEGHVQLLKFLTIPVFIDGEIVAVAGVANKDNDYEENDIRHLTLLMDSVWKISERISLINDLKKAKERAEKNERELKKAQEITHIGSWHLNVATNEVSWSEELYKMYGFNPSLPVPPYTEHMNLFTPESWDLLSSSLANTRETGIPYELELKTVRKDLSNGWMWVRGEAMRNNNNEIIALWGVAQDISERKQLEQELILAKEKAEESDRLKSAFLANMSHEIRTPMNGILGFTNLILEPDLSSEEKEEFINLVQKSGQRMLNTVNDIIEISKIEAGLVNLIEKKTDINDRVEDLTNFFRIEAEKKGLNLIFDKLFNSEIIILTDQNKFDSILSNLIKNAIKYTDTGTINIGCRQKGIEIEFYVKDTGIGIPTHRQKAVFNRFEQADIADKRVFEGSGLGLAIATSYVEMLGGKIWLESEEGIGSTFYFTLPYKAELKKESNVQQLTILDKTDFVRKLIVLIAEDDYVSEIFLSKTIKKYCKEILNARTGFEAIELCRQNKDVDLVLMDIKMPGMDGYEATRKIREYNKDVVIIAQTAYGLSGDREKAIQAGCNDYISKPIKLPELIEIINKHLSKSHLNIH